MTEITKPIFILGCSKSGTTLLRNLLDGHKDLFAIPSETHFFQNIKYWVSYQFRVAKPNKLSIDEMKKNLIDWVSYLNKTEDFFADSFTKNKWDIKVLEEKLNAENIGNIKNLSDAFWNALYAALYKEAMPADKRIVEKSVENAEFVFEWLNFYPDSKFIHIVRNPYSNLVSLRKYLDKQTKNRKVLFPRKNVSYFPHLRKAVYSMYNSFYFLEKNKRLVNNYKVVTYENLISHPETVMKEISNFLEIDFQEILLQPTLFGEDWAGNSITGQRFSGVSTSSLERWQKEITDFEIILVNRLFDFLLKEYNYPILLPNKNSIMKRAPKESIINYILNRLLIYYLPTY
jgi:hypothetical protein